MLFKSICKPLFWILLVTLMYQASSSIYAQDPTDVEYYELLRNYYVELANEDSLQQKTLNRVNAKIFDKLDQNGSMTSYRAAMSSTCADICTDPDLADWDYLGPPVYHTSTNVQWNGFVGEVLADERSVGLPTPEQNLLMGTPTAGAWRYDAFASVPGWENKTDALQNAGLGINKFLRDPFDPDYLLAATGMKNQKDYGNALGLIFSDDNGTTWQDFSLSNGPGIDDCHTNVTGIYYDYDQFGQKLPISLHFFITIRRDGAQDQLWRWCAPLWINESQSITFNTHEKIADFTANEDGSFLLTTSYPYGYATRMFRGVEPSDCNPINWTDHTAVIQSAGMDPTMNQEISISDSKSMVVFARTKGNDGDDLYKSIDGGVTWSLRHSSLQLKTSKLAIEYSPATGIVYLGGTRFHAWDDNNAVFYTAPSTAQHADVRDFSIAGFNPAGKEVCFMANDGGVTESLFDPSLGLSSSGISFRPISGDTMPIQQFWGIGITQSCQMNWAAGAMHNNSFLSNGGTVCKFGAGDGGDVEINPIDKTTVYYSINPFIYKDDINNLCSSGFGTLIGRTNQWQFGNPLELHPARPCWVFYGNDAGANPAASLVLYNDCPSAAPAPQPLSNANGNQTGHYLEQIGSIGLTEAKPLQVFVGNRQGSYPAGQSGKLLKIDNFGTGTWEDLSHNTVFPYNQPFTDVTGWMGVGDILVSPYDEDLVFVSMMGTSAGKRVFKSTNGGTTFTDYSDGLPDLPVNAMTYYYNSDDVVLVGTDAGVYYRDNSMSSWECFNENLPLVWVTDLDINYCKNTLVATTHGRGIYQSSLNPLPSFDREHEIASPEIWRDERVLYSDLVVKSGQSLDIIDATIRLAADVKITVEPGARLQILNSDLSALCEDACWDGITVQGNGTVLQTNANQGLLVVSGSTFSYGKSVINVFDGGIVRATGCNFINNRRSAQYLYYQSSNAGGTAPNIGFFDQCTFELNDDYRSNCGSNSPFVTLFGVDGVTFTGCLFTDQRTGLLSANEYRTGIGALEATIRVIQGTGPSNRFESLKAGITIENVQEDNPFSLRIEQAKFSANEIGISLLDVNNESLILKNEIEMGHPLGINSYGIVTKQSSGFTMEENHCWKPSGWPNWTRAYDILNTINPNNPGGSFFPYHLIYNNIAQNADEGFTAWGDNVAASGTGLEFLCNQNFDNQVDFHFLDCIQPQQGSLAQPAGNTFSCGSSTPFVIDAAATNCIDYYQEQGTQCTTFNPTGITINYTNQSPACAYLVSTSEFETAAPRFFPNPTDGQLTIQFAEPTHLVALSIYDLQGKLVRRVPTGQKQNTVTLEFASLPTGVYWVKGQYQDGTGFANKVVHQ
ncbi:hypothetical protein CEQ90_05655 [Lewinellaceae bacterium SD302]|nr:hypothetical protein CEQ90_05655 [Lewinellaceae bacterium SD302]